MGVLFAQFHRDTLQSWLATAEYIIGIGVEGVFVAMLVQTFFALHPAGCSSRIKASQSPPFDTLARNSHASPPVPLSGSPPI